MEGCFAACGCDDYEGVTKADWDRFTDKIENVLNDEKGRRLFRNYMFTCEMKDGRRALDFWEHTDKLIGYQENAESTSYRGYLRSVDKLIDDAEKIQELDFATMERLTIARDSENKEDIIEALKVLKTEVTKTLRREYYKFQRRFVPSK